MFKIIEKSFDDKEVYEIGVYETYRKARGHVLFKKHKERFLILELEESISEYTHMFQFDSEGFEKIINHRCERFDCKFAKEQERNYQLIYPSH